MKCVAQMPEPVATAACKIHAQRLRPLDFRDMAYRYQAVQLVSADHYCKQDEPVIVLISDAVDNPIHRRPMAQPGATLIGQASAVGASLVFRLSSC